MHFTSMLLLLLSTQRDTYIFKYAEWRTGSKILSRGKDFQRITNKILVCSSHNALEDSAYTVTYTSNGTLWIFYGAFCSF